MNKKANFYTDTFSLSPEWNESICGPDRKCNHTPRKKAEDEKKWPTLAPGNVRVRMEVDTASYLPKIWALSAHNIDTANTFLPASSRAFDML